MENTEECLISPALKFLLTVFKVSVVPHVLILTDRMFGVERAVLHIPKYYKKIFSLLDCENISL